MDEDDIYTDYDTDVTEDDGDLDADILLAVKGEAEALVEFDVIQQNVNASLINTNRIDRFITKTYNEEFYKEVTRSIGEEMVENEVTSANDSVLTGRQILQRLINEQRGIRS